MAQEQGSPSQATLAAPCAVGQGGHPSPWHIARELGAPPGSHGQRGWSITAPSIAAPHPGALPRRPPRPAPAAPATRSSYGAAEGRGAAPPTAIRAEKLALPAGASFLSPHRVFFFFIPGVRSGGCGGKRFALRAPKPAAAAVRMRVDQSS